MKNLIKIIASLTALTLMTACAGGVTVNPTVNTNGEEMPDNDKTDEMPDNDKTDEMPDNDKTDEMPDNDKTGGGNATDCTQTPFHDDCLMDTGAIALRLTMCLADIMEDDSCRGEMGIATLFCEANPFDGNCIDEIAYDVVRTPLCIEDKTTNDCTDTIARVCTDDPFGDLCVGDSNYNDARFRACSADATTRALTKCAPTVVRICPHDPFSTFCADDPNYNDTRRMACLPDPTAGVCGPTARRICTADPFDVFCAGTNYNLSRRRICLSETTSVRCMPTVDRICTPNIYDPVCNGTPYADMRSVADSQTEIGTRDCASNPGVDACIHLYAFLCGMTPLDSLCDAQGKYRDARRTLCLKDTADPVACATTVSQVCSDNPLDSLCDGLIAYASRQETACRGADATSRPECATTLTRVCGNLLGTSPTGDPFNGVCSNSVFNDARSGILSACVTAPDGRLCTAGLADICANTPFDDRCRGVESALPLQIRACIGQEATGNCADASFFTDSVILGCLADPSVTACTASDSAFEPYQIIVKDVACLASSVLADCANPTAVFATLPTTIRALRQNPDLSVPFHESTNQYTGGFVNFDSTVLNDDTGNLDAAKINALGNYLTEDANALTQSRAVTLRRGGADSTNEDGVAYFYTFGSSSEGATAYSYGGILPTTNLGAPLLPQPVAQGADNITAIWDGYFGFRDNIISGETEFRETEFLVDFTAGTMGFAKPVGTDGIRPPGTTFLGVGADGAPSVKWFNLDLFVRLDAAFGPNAKNKTTTYDSVTNSVIDTTTDLTLAPGQLGGNVYVYYRPTSDAAPEADADNFVRDNSTIHGLIGQEGAVAVFLEDGRPGAAGGNIGGHTRLGGFVASNPDHPNN